MGVRSVDYTLVFFIYILFLFVGWVWLGDLFWLVIW